MFELAIDVREDVRKLRNFSARGFNRINKEALQEAVLYWHRTFARFHFSREAYRRYPGAYKKRKKRGEPLVKSGDLRRHVLRRKSLADVTGTSKRAKLKMKFGRPSKYTDKMLRERIFVVMREEKLSFKQAQTKVYEKVGYGKKRVADFKEKMKALHTGEVNALRAFLKRFIVKRLNERGSKRRRKVA